MNVHRAAIVKHSTGEAINHIPTQQQRHVYCFAKCCRGHHLTRDSTLNIETTFAVSDNTTYSLKEGRSSKVSRELNDVVTTILLIPVCNSIEVTSPSEDPPNKFIQYI